MNRKRAKQYGLNLTEYTRSESDVLAGGRRRRNTPGDEPADAAAAVQPQHDLAGRQHVRLLPDVPTAVVRFLETDTQTKLIAKPQLRGAEGQKLTLNLGDQIPVLSTIFTRPRPAGSRAYPLSSFTYSDVGVNIDDDAARHLEGDIILDLIVESSALGPNISVAGQDVPSFGSRKVTTRLRLRDGESNLLAGLLREDERKSSPGFPGAIHVPSCSSCSSTNDEISQTDIVMLLTPHIVRTHELTVDDLKPIYIGTQQNLGLRGPPPLIQPPAADEPPAGAVPAQPPAAITDADAAVPAAAWRDAGARRPAVPPPSGEPCRRAVPTAPPAAPTGAPPPAGALPPARGRRAARRASVPPRDPRRRRRRRRAVRRMPAAQIIVTPPQEFRPRAGRTPCRSPITNASRLSTITLTVTFNPAVLARAHRAGGHLHAPGRRDRHLHARIDVAPGRVDITIARTGDAPARRARACSRRCCSMRSGQGNSLIQVSGVGSNPEGGAVPLLFAPVLGDGEVTA